MQTKDFVCEKTKEIRVSGFCIIEKIEILHGCLEKLGNTGLKKMLIIMKRGC